MRKALLELEQALNEVNSRMANGGTTLSNEEWFNHWHARDQIKASIILEQKKIIEEEQMFKDFVDFVSKIEQ